MAARVEGAVDTFWRSQVSRSPTGSESQSNWIEARASPHPACQTSHSEAGVLLQWQIINNKGIDMALGIIRTRITAIETRRVKAPEKTADSIYHTLNTAAGALG
jgi:hypothetical protein